MMMGKTKNAVVRFVVCALAMFLLLAPRASAHDLTPPDWRNLSHPYSTLQGWEFLTPLNPAQPDGTVPLIVGDGLGGGPPMATMSGMTWSPTGGWFTNPFSSGEIELTVPNWIDFEPFKLIRVQITYNGSDPQVVDIYGEDHVAGPVASMPNGPPVFLQLDPSENEWHMYQDWIMLPNPDWEVITISVPPSTFIQQIVVDTISVPEPTSVVLGGAALAALGLVVWRSRRRRIAATRA